MHRLLSGAESDLSCFHRVVDGRQALAGRWNAQSRPPPLQRCRFHAGLFRLGVVYLLLSPCGWSHSWTAAFFTICEKPKKWANQRKCPRASQSSAKLSISVTPSFSKKCCSSSSSVSRLLAGPWNALTVWITERISRFGTQYHERGSDHKTVRNKGSSGFYRSLLHQYLFVFPSFIVLSNRSGSFFFPLCSTTQLLAVYSMQAATATSLNTKWLVKYIFLDEMYIPKV